MSLDRRSAILAGTPYLFPVGTNSAVPLGNTAKLSYNVTIDKVADPNYEGGGGNSDVFYRFKEGTVALEVRKLSIDLFLLQFGGTAEAVAAAAVADEAQTVVALDTLIMLDHLQDMSEALTVKSSDGLTTFDEGTHYLRKRGGIIPLSNNGVAIVDGIAAGDALKIGYKKSKHQRIQALMNNITERGLYFDGVNERSNKPLAVIFHRLGFSPSKSVEVIGDQFMSFSLEGEILRADHVTDPAKSPFFEVLSGDL